MDLKIVTLMQSFLAINSIEYKRENKQSNPNEVVIKITTNTTHRIYGEVKIQLANVVNVNVDGVVNFFNTQVLSFTRTGINTLEAKMNWGEQSFFTQQSTINYNNTTNFVTLPNNGTAITIFVNNTILDVQNVNNFDFYIADSTATSGVINQAVSNPIGSGNNNKVSIEVADYGIINDYVILYTDDVDKHWDFVYKRQYIKTIGGNIRIGINDFVENTRIVIIYKVS